MAVRPFDWRDIPVLHRNREKSVYLDSVLVLTRGPLLVPGALFSTLAPSMGVFTYVANGGESDQQVFGQFIHLSGSPFAHLTFLAPDSALELSSTTALLDTMIKLCGERGAWRLLADVDQQSIAFESMRRNGFAIYARQRTWLMPQKIAPTCCPGAWRPAAGQDVLAIRSLYNNLVPGLVQQVEPFAVQPAPQAPKGLVYYEGDELLAFVEFKFGHKGIWAQPFVHPDAENVSDSLVDLLEKVPNRRSRPLYLCVRSYQGWLENILQDLGAQPGESQAVMVKHLAQPLKAGRTFSLPSLENGHAEVSTPIARLESK